MLSQIIPFSKIVSLRGGAYQGVKGESVCVPIEPDKVNKAIKKLPRKLSEAELVPLKLKRRLKYHGYYMFQVIRKDHVERGFTWLKQHNPLYQQNVTFNDQWMNPENSSMPQELIDNVKQLMTNDDYECKVEEHEPSEEKPESGACQKNGI